MVIKNSNSKFPNSSPKSPPSPVSGQIQTGEMVAIIGSSGAGKTSLMAALCSRIRGKIKGDFYYNQLPANKNLIGAVTGFVPQYETAVGVLTVAEHLHFVAQLKLGRSMPPWEKESRVKKVVARLGMTQLRTSRIKHLSGGERKKLNLAEELLREPLFLFCDEPTTGLDRYNSLSLKLLILYTILKLYNYFSFNGKSVMQSLKILTNGASEDESAMRAVICSIHQPSSEVFNYFSHIILMDNGSIVYHDKISTSYVKLDTIGLSLPKDYNPAEFFVKLVSPIPVNNIEHDDRIVQLSELNRERLEAERIELLSSAMMEKRKMSAYQAIEHLTWFAQIAVLMKRATIVGFRDFGDAIINSSSHVIIAMGIGILYAGTAANPQASITDVQGMFFNIIAQIFFYTYKGVIDATYPEMPIVRKETGENLYFISSYYIMKFLSLVSKKSGRGGIFECGIII